MKIGDIIRKGKNKYEIVKFTTERVSYGSGKIIRAYLKALDSKENRIGIVRRSGSIDFETRQRWGSMKEYYRSWE